MKMMISPILWKTDTEGKQNFDQQVSVYRCRSLLRQLRDSRKRKPVFAQKNARHVAGHFLSE